LDVEVSISVFLPLPSLLSHAHTPSLASNPPLVGATHESIQGAQLAATAFRDGEVKPQNDTKRQPNRFFSNASNWVIVIMPIEEKRRFKCITMPYESYNPFPPCSSLVVTVKFLWSKERIVVG
jgi:hypothetical protein